MPLQEFSYADGLSQGRTAGYRQAIADLRGRADAIESECPVEAKDLRQAAQVLEALVGEHAAY